MSDKRTHVRCGQDAADHHPLAQSRAAQEQGVSQDINVLALVKGEERYVFLFDDAHRSDALRTLGRFASNPELSFSWYDAAVLSQRIRQTAAAVEEMERAEEQQRADAAHVEPPKPHRPRFQVPQRKDPLADEMS